VDNPDGFVMKRSRLVLLTLAGVSLSVTGCGRKSEVARNVHGTAVMPPAELPPQERAALPIYSAGKNPSLERPPNNAYDPQLGYFHLSCQGWFPYPYDHYDSRYGYYRCGRWHRTNQGRSHYHHSSGGSSGGSSRPLSGGSTVPEYSSQPTGAPVHGGVNHSSASHTKSAFTSRGGFGSSGSSSGGWFSRS
jgi:hypothetical protein